ncbi:MAG: FtsX-like permease family protein, partial [Gemmatimonadaceae bacterium]
IGERPDVIGAVPVPSVLGVRDVFVDIDTARVQIEAAAPGWLALVDVPIILGRDLSPSDTAASDYPVVIGSDLAQRLWPDVSPIGRTLVAHVEPMPRDSTAMTVVGVFDATRDMPEMTRDRNVARASAPARVFTARGNQSRSSGILVRTRGPAVPLLPSLRRFLRAEAPSLPVLSMRTLEQADAQAFRAAVRKSGMAAAAGALPVLLASLGLFGVVSLAVRQRTREIGIRIAVGARPMQVARMFLASGISVSAVALVLGLPLSVVAVKLGLSPVFTPDGNPFLVGIVVAALQVAVASAATWIPARRAALVDPARTLRVD